MLAIQSAPAGLADLVRSRNAHSHLDTRQRCSIQLQAPARLPAQTNAMQALTSHMQQPQMVLDSTLPPQIQLRPECMIAPLPRQVQHSSTGHSPPKERCSSRTSAAAG